MARVRDPRVVGNRRLQLLQLIALLPERLGVNVLEQARERRPARAGLGLAERGQDLLPHLVAQSRVGGILERTAPEQVLAKGPICKAS